jgi:DNA-binding NarL/FixJ family response regulator
VFGAARAIGIALALVARVKSGRAGSRPRATYWPPRRPGATTALERWAKAELAAIGVRPGTTDRTGVASLTPSELRVAELAAAGGTNREIAQTLFVTEKAVETHLGRAFRRLGISSRASFGCADPRGRLTT